MFHRVGYGLTTAFTMDDVITMLQVRRSIENPIRFDLLRGPGREIALTAQRIIVRKRIA